MLVEIDRPKDAEEAHERGKKCKRDWAKVTRSAPGLSPIGGTPADNRQATTTAGKTSCRLPTPVWSYRPDHILATPSHRTGFPRPEPARH